jgi:WD40-like Beta Propeller Repeat
MPGGSGGMDIYFVTKSGDDWSTPINAGKLVNTPGDEFFPFLDNRNNLYFSSNGITGYGGFDIYISRFNGTGWEKPVNLAHPVNSDDDDIAFVMSKPDGKSAFFTRRHLTGNREMMLFRLTINDSAVADTSLTLADLFSHAGREEAPKTLQAETPKSQNTVTEQEAKVTGDVKMAEAPKEPQADKNPPVAAESSPVIKPAEVKKEETAVPPRTVSSPINGSSPANEKVVYRVQIYISGKSIGSQKITIDNVVYASFEYLYQGSYRTTLGEFSTMAQASKLQKACWNSGFPGAFVVAFKNNERSTDPALYK